ncbi:hypothetical protein FGIG_04953 [Fasciola gigantica]|uniref:General transcription factor 3C polypeptide 2 n=1 Tax=Fasciola gigantica TaxID=46835 RepID=A0A504Z379_FASGI|nr:hypothetical protein FGIG_04953 [Fasciola gigantica]
MGEPRRSRRSSAKACLRAISGMAKELYSDDEVNSCDLDDSGAEFVPSEESSESESSPSEAPSNDLEAPGSAEEPSDTSFQQAAKTKYSGQARGTLLSGAIERSILNLSTSTYSPLVKYMSSCRMLQLKCCKDVAVWHFSKCVERLRRIFDTKFHPFLFHSSLYKDEFDARQSVLFPTTLSWVPYPVGDPLHCLPKPPVSPLYSCHPNSPSYKQLHRFEFDPENKLLYVGGLVQSISWSPPRTPPVTIGGMPPDSSTVDTVYLAVATLPSPDSRIFYTDPVSTHPGLIQVWDCGKISLKPAPPDWTPLPHVFIVHNWGHVLDLCWLPISVFLVNPKRTPPADLFPLADSRVSFDPFPQINRVGGHLIAACQDGLVRVFAVSRLKLDQVHFINRGRLPFYALKEGMSINLSVSPDENPGWLGWPTRLHIRSEFPDRLFVGYSRGHVALYNLSCLHPQFFMASKKHLSPIKLFRLLSTPVVSLSLNAMNGRYLIARGLDLRCAVWDLEDVHASNPISPEMSFSVIHGLLGREVLWPSRGDIVLYSREYAISKRYTTDSGGKLLDLNDIANRSDSYVQQTYLDTPHECGRNMIPLGLQSTSSMDFSDPLNTLLCATDRGRLELVLCSLDGRVKQYAKQKFLAKLRIPLCQWALEKISDESGRRNKNGIRLDSSILEHNVNGKSSSPSDCTKFADESQRDECLDCTQERSFCSHKLRTQYRLRLHDDVCCLVW